MNLPAVEPTDTIVITHEDLQDAAIDERLAQQRNAGPAALQPVGETSRFAFLYSTWFYLMLAGAFGAFLGWAFIEPSFDDGLTFTGRVEQVETDNFAPGLRRITVSGVPVALSFEKTHVRGAANSQVGYTVDDLKVDSIVKIMGERVEATPLVVAIAVRIEPPNTPFTSKVDIPALAASGTIAGTLLFPVVAGLIGLWVGCIEGLICRTFRRAVRCGIYGLAAGGVGGFLGTMIGGITYMAVGALSNDPTSNAGAFLLQMFRRGLAWTIVGTATGLGQGLALKNRKLLLNGFVGGLIGGLLGGLLFDPIDLLFSDRAQMQGAEISRAIGLTMIGGAVGVLIGITDMLTRVAWLRVLAGPLRGKEFSFTQAPIRLGSSPKNEIYLFKDAKIDPIHAVINKLRDTYEIADSGSSTGTFVNRQKIQRVRLSDGDRITIGESEFVYSTRNKKR